MSRFVGICIGGGFNATRCPDAVRLPLHWNPTYTPARRLSLDLRHRRWLAP